jgi:hypothetical protein
MARETVQEGIDKGSGKNGEMNGEMNRKMNVAREVSPADWCCGSGAVERNCPAREEKPWRRRRHQHSHEG